MVGVAQLVEPRVVIPVVVGSSPIVHPNFKVTSFVQIIVGALQWVDAIIVGALI